LSTAASAAKPAAPAGGPTPAAPASPPRQYGNLKDQDRIFTNLYGEEDFGVDAAIKRVRPTPFALRCWL
jgi:hypothetical protein